MQSKGATIQTLEDRVAALQQQAERFNRHIFGSKSEHFTARPNPQLHLGETLIEPSPVAAYTLRVPKWDAATTRCCSTEHECRARR